MANEMRTFVNVVSDEPRVATRLQEIFKFEKVDGKYEPNALDIINNIKGTSYSYSDETTKEDWNEEEDFPSGEVWDEMIGPRWLYVEYVHVENEPKMCNIVLRTAWSVPTSFLNVLRNELQKIDPECYLYGDYEDESYEPCGSFVYGKFNYDAVEDYDEPFDWDEHKEDDCYLENYHEEIHKLSKDLENVYLEYLQDRIDNPQDHEL